MPRDPSTSARQKLWAKEADKHPQGWVFCWRCSLRIDPIKHKWHSGHTGRAKAFGGKEMRPEHADCNMLDCWKTVIPAVAKSNRVWARHHEKKVSRNPVLGSKASKYKKCVNGDVVERATGRVIKQGRR